MINLIVTLTSISHLATEPTIDIHKWTVQVYGPEITFDIKRNGKNIGTHEVNFQIRNEQLLVEAKTRIRVKFLFFTAFKFDYTAKEIWQDGEIVSLQSFTNDNGKITNVNLEYGANVVNVINDGKNYSNSLDGPVYTTNHWNPNVLNASEVLNTITGKSNKIQIDQMEKEMVPTSTGERPAMHHRYNGELNNISSWYDDKMRWVGLIFQGKDGSLISYECNLCGDE